MLGVRVKVGRLRLMGFDTLSLYSTTYELVSQRIANTYTCVVIQVQSS